MEKDAEPEKKSPKEREVLFNKLKSFEQRKKINQFVKQEFYWNSCKTKFVNLMDVDLSRITLPPESITLNPETVILPFDPEKIVILNLCEYTHLFYKDLLTCVFSDKKLTEKYYFPGFEFPFQFFQNKNLIPQRIKDELENDCMLLGSLIGTTDGRICSTTIQYSKSRLNFCCIEIIRDGSMRDKAIAIKR